MTLSTLKRHLPIRLTAVALTLALVACAGGGEDTTDGEGSSEGGSASSNEVAIDGSSTVFPIARAMAVEFMEANSDVEVTVAFSGSGGGFEKFCAGETDISNASRPIKQKEIDACAEAGIEFVEVPVAFDGLSVVVHPDNDWAACMTAEELGKMWEPDAEDTITNWNQVNDEFPDKALALYGPGTDSGTYDYFTDATTGEEGKSRADYTATEDDNIIVKGVQDDDGGLGFFGYAYYEENKDSLKVVEIKNSDGDCIAPSLDVIADGTYNPLARPIFFYVKTSSLEEKPAVADFVNYQIDAANSGLIGEAGYVPLPEDILEKVQVRVDEKTTGSIYEGGSSVGVKLSDKL
ncbi:MAG: PstS family phosphate ABC transporter substrate-binding protein [Spirulina sp. SIO3F2]|nr:PstS family phosphate ABC transporter substrate-binding protein [Spirulina sp. SIO3F2]